MQRKKSLLCNKSISRIITDEVKDKFLLFESIAETVFALQSFGHRFM